MYNGQISRGELYWISEGEAHGCEIKTGRPGVIISSDYGNDNMPTVIVAFTTTQMKYGRIYPYIHTSGYRTYVLCNQLRTVDKTRIEKKIGTLTDAEMSMVERGIKEALFLGDTDTEDEVEKLNVELDMWKRMYKKVMEELVATKVEADIASRMKGTG